MTIREQPTHVERLQAGEWGVVDSATNIQIGWCRREARQWFVFACRVEEKIAVLSIGFVMQGRRRTTFCNTSVDEADPAFECFRRGTLPAHERLSRNEFTSAHPTRFERVTFA